MNEFFKKLLEKAQALWAGWGTKQKLILVGSAVLLIVGLITLFRVSASPVFVSVIDAPIRDEIALERIIFRLNEENVRVHVTPNGLVQVADEITARRMRMILMREDLIPQGVDPWDIFNRDRWTYTDFERNVNFRRAQQRMITDHIRAVDGVDDVSLTIVVPERELFGSMQNPVTASVVITPRPGSDIVENRQKIEGIQRLLRLSVEGLTNENIVITSTSGIVLNNFEDMAAFDRLTLIQRESRHILEQETNYRRIILQALQSTFTADRVRDLNIKIDKDLSKQTVSTTEFFPFTLRPRTPGLPYDDSELFESVLRSETISETMWTGSGYVPEGPPGGEAQMPPAFRDMSNLFGEMNQVTRTHNHELNERNTLEERSPQIDRVTVSVNIDGRWIWKYDEKGNPVILPDNSIEREYIPVPPEDLRRAEALIRDAIGYNSARGDSVTVTNIAFDRTEEFAMEDAEYHRRRQRQTTIIIFLSGLTLLLFGFIMFRTISREMERRRRLAEEERARREQMLRESQMAEMEQDGMDVSISMEERNRMELMESVINMAKEHPEDAAQLLRTWLLEE